MEQEKVFGEHVKSNQDDRGRGNQDLWRHYVSQKARRVVANSAKASLSRGGELGGRRGNSFGLWESGG